MNQELIDKEKMDNKKKSEILAILFGTIFLLIFIYCLAKFISRIWLEYQKERINRRNRQLLLVNDSVNLDLI